MKFSEQWLREWVNPPVSTEELVAQLTMAGLEVDSVTPAAPAFTGVVVGKVLAVEAHPDAERLRVCRVDAGEAEPLTIVCGASNVTAGMAAPLARIDAVLPDGTRIKKSKLRGVESFGMLCSAKELGLAESAEGLMALPSDAPTGGDVFEYLGLDDQIVEIDLTPNRGDCLGLAGVAREVGVLNRCEVHAPDFALVPASIPDTFPVTVDASADCPRYLGRVVRGIDARAATPLWMQERLRRGGIRSLGAVVDVTNYVLLELGQPMHAFDLSKLAREIRVRGARADEPVRLLDGRELKLTEGSLVIADAARVHALAGIMGGDDAAVGEATVDLFFECAFFAPAALAGRARAYGLHTESSHRFERGVDPQLQRRALERATQLLLEIAGGAAGPVIEVASEVDLPARKPIDLRAARVRRLLGVDIPAEEVVAILERLGMAVERITEGWRVVPPSFRFDIEREVDLIEELARVYGYERIPTRSAVTRLPVRPRPETRSGMDRLRRTLVERGYQEVVTYSFVDPALQRLLQPEESALALANPISSEMSVMRTSLWPGLIKAMQHNLNRQQGDLKFFESGLNFVMEDNELTQKKFIAGTAIGSALPEQWGLASRPVDFFDLKADIEALCACPDDGEELIYVPAPHPALHPGRCARIERAGVVLGWIGALHPRIERTLDLPGQALVFEFDLEVLEQARLPLFRELSRFPAIRRDIAIVVDEGVSADAVRACVRAGAPELLRELRLFDVYRGKGVESGRKSMALGLILQDSSRTLKEQDVEAVIQGVLSRLRNELNATLRD